MKHRLRSRRLAIIIAVVGVVIACVAALGVVRWRSASGDPVFQLRFGGAATVDRLLAAHFPLDSTADEAAAVLGGWGVEVSKPVFSSRDGGGACIMYAAAREKGVFGVWPGSTFLKLHFDEAGALVKIEWKRAVESPL